MTQQHDIEEAALGILDSAGGRMGRSDLVVALKARFGAGEREVLEALSNLQFGRGRISGDEDARGYVVRLTPAV